MTHVINDLANDTATACSREPAPPRLPAMSASHVALELDDQDTVVGMQAEVLRKQHRLMGLAGSVVARRIVNLFDAAPRLSRLKASFDYSWGGPDLAPVRGFRISADSTFAAEVLNDTLVSATALDSPLWVGDARSVSDVEVDFNLALEASALLQAVGTELDVGRLESRIDVSRRAINRMRNRAAGTVRLQDLASQMFSF